MVSRARKLLEEDVRSIPTLIQAKRSAHDALRFKYQVQVLPDWKTTHLLPRLETTLDPLMLWAIHLELDKREIPPCLRIPSNQLGPQGDYINLTADLFWFQRKHPDHRPTFRGWRNTLNASTGSSTWHEHIYRQFLFTYPRGMAHLVSKGLALTEKQRQQLLSVPTTRMTRDRAYVEGKQFTNLLSRLITYSTMHPDKAGTHPPEVIARRKAYIYRTHLITGRSATRTAEYWQRITGEHISRQAIAAHIERANKALRLIPQ